MEVNNVSKYWNEISKESHILCGLFSQKTLRKNTKHYKRNISKWGT